MSAKDLDGTYRITTVSNYDGPVKQKSDGTTIIKDGKTNRVDDSGCEWSTTITPISDNQVEFISIADPTHANADFCLTGENGQLTRNPVTYKTVLKLDRMGEKIRMSGQIEHGAMTTIITLIKIA